MSSEASQFEQLIEQVRQGSHEAAWDLIERYGPRFIRIVRRQLPDEMRSKFDSEDFVQAAWASLFAHTSKIAQFTCEDQFVAFATAVVSNKVRMEVRRRLKGQKYNVHRERDGELTMERSAADDTTPSQIAMARERWFRMMESQPEHYREMIRMRFYGMTMREIAVKMNVHENTVQRVLQRVLQAQLHEC